MRVISWNCHRASARSKVWDYLIELDPDVALLQEVCGIPQFIEDYYSIIQQPPVRKNGSPQNFMTSVLVRGSFGNRIVLKALEPWVNAELARFSGNLVGIEIQPKHGPSLNIICIYSPAWPVDKARLVDIDVTSVRLTQNRNVWVTDLLWAALSLNPPQANDAWIIGGDLNMCETFDAWGGRPRGNREYLDKMEKLGLVDCLRYKKGDLTPTYKTLGKNTITAQIDHLFVTDTLRLNLAACDTGCRDRVFGGMLSDHLPIVADFATDLRRPFRETKPL